MGVKLHHVTAVMIRTILFPVDFSPPSAAMAAYVRRAAEMFGSSVTLVHVCDLMSNNGFELVARNIWEIAEDHKTVAGARLKSFLDSDFPPATCSRILRSGETAAEIAEVAKTGAFDLIVMPTHAGRFRRMLLGSTTAKVLNDADCPVMTTQHADALVPRPLEHRVWLCAIGLSQDSERVLRLASRAAATVGASLSIIHATHRGAESDARRRLQGLLKTVGCDAQLRVITGPVRQALLGEARRSGADALIVGRRPRIGPLGRIRDLTYSLVRDSPAPVLSV